MISNRNGQGPVAVELGALIPTCRTSWALLHPLVDAVLAEIVPSWTHLGLVQHVCADGALNVDGLTYIRERTGRDRSVWMLLFVLGQAQQS